jgi:sarcosine dehydrogenase
VSRSTDCQYLNRGAGVWGSSIAHHLVELGIRDVILVDKWDVADGSSWAAAGFVGQVRHRVSDIQLVRYSAGLYAEFERTFPSSIGWGGEGSLRLSYSEARTAEYATLVSHCQAGNVDARVVNPAEAAELAPQLDLTGLHSAIWVPSDGSVVPERLARMMAGAAQAAGARVLTGVEAHRFRMRGEEIEALETSSGDITADHYIVAGGMFTPLLLETAGIRLPLYARQANYVVSNCISPADLGPMPTVRVPDMQMYARISDSRIAVGATRIPPVFELAENVPNARRFHTNVITDLGGALPDAELLIPALGDAGSSHAVTAFESATPDSTFIAGETAVPGLWVAAGGQGWGIAAAGGLGRAMARELVGVQPELDLSTYSPARFGAQNEPFDSASLERVRASYGDRYAIAGVRGS